MRKLIVTLVAGLVGAFVMSSTAQATPTFTLLSGGFASVSASASQTVTFDLIFSYAAGDTVAGYAVTITWDGGPIAEFDLASGVSTSAPGFVIPVPLVITDSAANTAGTASSYGAAAFAPVGGPLTATIGTLKLHVIGANGGTITPVLIGGDGVATGVCSPASPGACVFNSATVNVIPEPATAALLGLGLFGIGVAGRRARSS